MAEGGKMADDEPMSVEKQFLLDVHQRELVKRIDLEHTHLLDLLRDRGVLLFSQHEDIRVLPENKKCEEAIKILQKKTDRDFDEFCGALRETGHGHLVHHYLSKAAIHKRISHLQRRLATYYSNTYKDDMFTYHQEDFPREKRAIVWLTRGCSSSAICHLELRLAAAVNNYLCARPPCPPTRGPSPSSSASPVILTTSQVDVYLIIQANKHPDLHMRSVERRQR